MHSIAPSAKKCNQKICFFKEKKCARIILMIVGKRMKRWIVKIHKSRCIAEEKLLWKSGGETGIKAVRESAYSCRRGASRSARQQNQDICKKLGESAVYTNSPNFSSVDIFTARAADSRPYGCSCRFETAPCKVFTDSAFSSDPLRGRAAPGTPRSGGSRSEACSVF